MESEVKVKCELEEKTQPELEYYKIEPVDLDLGTPETEQELEIFKLEPNDKDMIPLFEIDFAL